MKFMNKIPGSRTEPPGLERLILSKIPQAMLACTLIPVSFYLFVVAFPALFTEASPEKVINAAQITTIATVITFWTIIFTVAIFSFIVMIMKGPAYVADAYPLSDSEKPLLEMKEDESSELRFWS